MAFSILSSLPSAKQWQQFRSSKILTLVTVCIAMFTDGFIYGVVTPIMPFLLEEKQLVTKGYLITSNYVLLAAFSLSDLVTGPLCAMYVDYGGSRLKAWYAGIALLTAGTALFCSPHHYMMLVFCQMLHGASSAVLYTLSFSMLVDKVDSSEVGTYVGTMMTFCNIGIVLSPVVGGLLYGKPGVYSIVAIMFACGFVNLGSRILLKTPEGSSATLGLAPSLVEPVRSRTDSAIEEKDSLSLRGAIEIAEITVVPSPTSMKRSWTTRVRSVFVQRASGFKRLLASKRLASALYGIFVGEFVIAAILCTIFVYAKETFGWNARDSSFLSFCIAIPAIAGPAYGWLTDKLGARKVTIASIVIGAPVLFVLRLVDHNSLEQKVLLCALLSLSALALTGIMTPLSAEFAHVASEITEHDGHMMVASSYSLLNCSVALAGGLGPIAGGGVMEAGGWKAMTILLGVVCVSAIVPCVIFTGNKGTRAAAHKSSSA